MFPFPFTFGSLSAGHGLHFASHQHSGRYIYAIGNSEKVTYLSGIKTHYVLILAFVISGICSSTAGMMLQDTPIWLTKAWGMPTFYRDRRGCDMAEPTYWGVVAVISELSPAQFLSP